MALPTLAEISNEIDFHVFRVEEQYFPHRSSYDEGDDTILFQWTDEDGIEHGETVTSVSSVSTDGIFYLKTESDNGLTLEFFERVNPFK